MKRMIAFFYITFVISESCNKDASQKSYNNLIQGTWELRQTSAQSGVKNYEPENGNLFYFTQSNFQKYKSGQLMDSGIYKMIHDTTASGNVCLLLPENEYRNRIQFNNIELPKQFFQISNDSLYFLSGCFAIDSGTSSIYLKKTSGH